MNQFVILSFGVDPLNWPSFIEIGEIACSTPACLPAWCLQVKFDFRLNILKMFNLKLNLSCKQMAIITPTSVPDPDLEIRRGPSHPDPEIRGGGP